MSANFWDSVSVRVVDPYRFELTMGKHDVTGNVCDVLIQVKPPNAKSPSTGIIHSVTAREMELLMTKMWDAGIRPEHYHPGPGQPLGQAGPSSQEAFLAGKVEGMQDHLNDMRKIIGLLPRPETSAINSADSPMTGRGGAI